jgi:hypothetical protein
MLFLDDFKGIVSQQSQNLNLFYRHFIELPKTGFLLQDGLFW